MTGKTAKSHVAAATATALAAAILLLPAAAPAARAGPPALSATHANENLSMTPQPTMPPARDPEIAVKEEYQIARQRGTSEALELFIARHPDGPLADKARADLRRIPR